MAIGSSTNYERMIDNGSGSPGNAELAIEIFSGSVREAFYDSTILFDQKGTFIDMRDITGQGASAQFVIIGDDPVPVAHTPGTVANVQASEGTNVSRLKNIEKNIAIDGLLDNPLDIPKVDFNTVPHARMVDYGKKIGRGMAQVFDRRAFLLGCKAARSAAVSGVHQGGTQIYRDDGSSTTSGSASLALAYPKSTVGSLAFRTDLVELGQALSEKSVPGPWILFVIPHITSVLHFESTSSGDQQMPSIFSRDAAGDKAANAALRYIMHLEGFDIFETNHLPSINMNGSSGTAILDIVSNASKYQGNFSGAYHATTATAKAQGRPVALCFAGVGDGRYPLGGVHAGGLNAIAENDNRRKTTFFDGEMHYGLDTLHVFCAGDIEIYRDG